jgi:pimeloyl-ACP methyl ester carboxylesterase
MPRSAPVDGFRLAYDRHGAGPAVVLLHGWPGDRADHRAVVPRLRDRADVVVPDLRGFGGSDRRAGADPSAYAAAAQARSVLGLIDELGLQDPVIAGYDVGSRLAQTLAPARSPRRSAGTAPGPRPSPAP